MREEFTTLRSLLSSAVGSQPYDGLLFSGGLDTAVIAVLNPKVTAVTVSLGNDAEDIYYSNLLAKKLGFKHVLYTVDIEEALGAIPEVIKIMHSFDPAIPNDLAVYFGLKKAKELGITAIATGDASDELFGGYSFMEDIEDLETYIRKISEKMRFSSNDIGKFLGLKIVQPFTDKKVINFALGLPRDMKIREEDGHTWGKWIIRKTFEDILSKEVAWQSKRPLEYGSGMTRLRDIISAKISDDEFKEKQQTYSVKGRLRSASPPPARGMEPRAGTAPDAPGMSGASSAVKLLNKEHLYYYEIFRKVAGHIPAPKGTEKPCQGCGAGLEIDAIHCKVCGDILMREDTMLKKHKKVFVSWSGGKDSVLACYNAMKSGETEVTYLLNMLSENGTHSRSHHLSAAVLKSQAEAMNIPIVQRQATWPDYEEEFKKALAGFKKEGVQIGVFGDIDVQEHRDWVSRVCNEADMEALLPLWQRTRESLMEEFILAGFKAVIVTVNSEFLGNEWLGRQLDRQFVEDIKCLPNVDLCGENGEYHTFVYDGPIFKKSVEFITGEKILKDNHWFLEIKLRNK